MISVSRLFQYKCALLVPHGILEWRPNVPSPSGWNTLRQLMVNVSMRYPEDRDLAEFLAGIRKGYYDLYYEIGVVHLMTNGRHMI